MKKHSKLTLKNTFSCNEKWSSIKREGEAPFCNKCQKNVIDFDKLTNQEILAIFERKSTKNVCAKMNRHRLAQFNQRTIGTSFGWSQISTLFGLLLLSNTQTIAQQVVIDNPLAQEISQKDSLFDKQVEHIEKSTVLPRYYIKGHVVDDENEPVILGTLALYVDGKLIAGVETDFEGAFFMAIDSAYVDGVLELSYVGFPTKRFSLKDYLNKEAKLVINKGESFYIGILVGGFSSVEVISKRKRFFNKIKRFFRRKGKR